MQLLPYTIEQKKKVNIPLSPSEIITDHLTLSYIVYKIPKSEINYKLAETPDADYYEESFILEENSVSIPVAEEIESTIFTNNADGNLEISPIAMNVNLNRGIDFSNTYDGDSCIDNVYKMEISYKDGTSYLIYAVKHPYDTGSVYDPSEEVASFSYICGSIDNHVITLFNRLVDVDNIEKITINNTEFTQK